MESASTRGSAASRGSCCGQLRLDHGVVRHRVRAVERREVEHVHEQPRALDVREEVVSEPGAGACPLDQPGDVGDDELAVVGLERAEHRLERRERVGGDLRLRARHAREQRRLAGVRAARRGRRRRAASSGGRRFPPSPGRPRSARRGAWRTADLKRVLPRPPAPPRATVTCWPGRTRSKRVPSQRVTCVPGGTAMTSGSPSRPWRCAPWPCPPRSARKCARRRKRLEVAQVVVAAQDDVPAAPAVAAVGTALRHVRLAAERQRRRCRRRRRAPRSLRRS